ncbi:MAG: ABC transporter ATP-binding protein [Clostridium sp.]
MSLINMEGINKFFGKDNNKTHVLKDINLTINSGEFVAIIGPSGSGKSSLLNIIGGLDSQTSGEYTLDNINVKAIGDKGQARIRNEKIGFIVQHFALLNDYTVGDNVAIPLEYSKNNKIPKKDRKQRIKDVLVLLKIEDKIDVFPKEISGGQCQRVAIARAIVNNPDLILADEPTGALDTKTGQDVIDIFKNLNKKGKTLVIVTHDMAIANQADRIINIVDGKIIN